MKTYKEPSNMGIIFIDVLVVRQRIYTDAARHGVYIREHLLNKLVLQDVFQRNGDQMLMCETNKEVGLA